jgi:hypothetical protein
MEDGSYASLGSDPDPLSSHNSISLKFLKEIFARHNAAAGGGGLCTVLTHSGQHMDELLELGKELGAEAVVLAGTDTARLAAGDRNGGDTHFQSRAVLRIRDPVPLNPGSGMGKKSRSGSGIIFPKA